ncbi:hypothetical protein [Sedimenticola hydrogenitrophicus]|uniref:hypothetical protein n=1 Tax=Sedimenticola hydrogenitrophicus TaxID=2967975 RepID=UPI0021A8317D|nr:hypothetical protein [Sedimenticola hydrogenitrophicus]
MALCSDAAMVLYYDIVGDYADHDDWHTYEHMHERLSIPGFIRATRWVAQSCTPKYMVLYEVAGTGIATSTDYLERLNHPTPWTTEMMSRFRDMIRGFCTVAGSSGFGLGHAAVSVRFTPVEGAESTLSDQLVREVLPAMASRRGMAGVHLLRPVPPPPMTIEQSIRGPDTPMSWLLLATGYDAEALRRATDGHLKPQSLERYGASPGMVSGSYVLNYTATAQEVMRTEPNPTLPADVRASDGVRS